MAKAKKVPQKDLSFAGVYKRVGNALDQAIAAAPVLLGNEFKFDGKEALGPRRETKKVA